MKTTLLFAALFGLAAAAAFADSTTFSNIVVTGTASINQLDVTGNSAIFGAWTSDASEPGVSFTYTDETGGTNASFTTVLTRPASTWNWLRLDGSGNAWGVMELTASNQLILTGTQTSSPGSIVIDPTSGQITVNGQQVLTNGNSSGTLSGGDIAWDSSGDLTATGYASFNNGGTYFGTNYSSDIISTEIEEPLEELGSTLGIINNHSSDNTSILFLQSSSGPYGQATFLRMNNPDYSTLSWQLQEYGSDGHFAVDLESVGDAFTLNQDFSGALAGGNIIWDGSGDLSVNGYVGIGTTTPQANLDVNGSANFSGPVELQPQGDLSMGPFTSGSGGGGGDGGDDAMGGFGGGAFTTGTSH